MADNHNEANLGEQREGAATEALHNVGEQMKGALVEALQSGDFAHLNDLLVDTVENTLKEAHVPVWQQRAAQREQEKQQRIQQDWQQKVQAQIARQRKPSKIVELIKFNRVGSVSSVLYKVFGGIGLGFTILAGFGQLILTWFGESGGWPGIVLFLLLFAGMIRLGISQAGRLKRAERYAELCGNKMYGDVDKIAASTGWSSRKVLQDIRKMLRVGIFPEGHLDEQGKWFMLNDVIYKQYLALEDTQKQKERENRQAIEQKQDPQSLGEMVSEARKAQDAELNTMVAEGMEYIRKLRDLNDKIPGEVISTKLYRLENLLNEIFDNLREHPEQRHRMHKLMDYYLPITLKLVEAYEEFDGISAPGQNILSAKAEIEKTLDIINQAFAELLNNLFQDTVLDVTTDAQVLQTMLAQEGLTREPEFAELFRK